MGSPPYFLYIQTLCEDPGQRSRVVLLYNNLQSPQRTRDIVKASVEQHPLCRSGVDIFGLWSRWIVEGCRACGSAPQ